MKTRILPLGAFLFLCCTIFFVACKKDISNPNPVIVSEEQENFAIPAASPVRGSVSGLVVDEYNNPVPSADVTFGSTVYQTDARGFFNINNVQLDKYVSTVSVQKTGYFKALRAFSASATRNYVSIKLIQKLCRVPFLQLQEGPLTCRAERILISNPMVSSLKVPGRHILAR